MDRSDARLDAGGQLPGGDQIFLDHVGLFVRDPQAAARALSRLGFAPTPVSVQVDPEGKPTGTGNVCAMLRGGYLEVLFKTADTPLGREFDAAVARYSGIQLAAFAVADAAAAHGRLASAGFPVCPLAKFQRPVGTETGEAQARFTVARVEPGVMPEGRIQILTHHTPDAIWQPRWLDHPNGAVALTSIVIAVADVDEAAARFARFTGRPASPSRAGHTIALDRGRIELVTASAFAQALPEIPIPILPFVGACGIAVESQSVLESLLRDAGIRLRSTGRCLVVPCPQELGHGAWVFSAIGDEGLF